MPTDYYKILSISQDANSAQIKQNAQIILNKTKKEYATNLQEIKKAYSVISNPKHRQIYDSKSNIRYYQVLRICVDTEPSLIKGLAQNTVTVVKQEYERKVEEIREAYSVLSNLDKKTAYDDAIFQQEYQKRKAKLRRLQQSQVKKRKFTLTKILSSIFFIGLAYFGYANYQEIIQKPTIVIEELPLEIVEKMPVLPKKTYTPLYTGEPTEQVSTNSTARIYKPFSPQHMMAKTIEDEPSRTAEDILAEEKQPDSLGFYRWEEDARGYANIMAIANSSEEPVLIYFHADWCPWCRKLEKQYFADYQVENFLHSIPKVKIAPENGYEEKQLFSKYNGTGYPSVFVYIPAFGSKPIGQQPFRGSETWSPATYVQKLKNRVIREYSKHAYSKSLLGKSEEARYYYRKALLYDPKNANTYYNIGLSYHTDGSKKRNVELLRLAKMNYLEALKYDFDHKSSQKNLKILEKIL
ncbi:MAG: thioredoxin family protein [Candidatus Marithrix sp.]